VQPAIPDPIIIISIFFFKAKGWCFLFVKTQDR
jgi:hypothetical protein